MTGTPEHHTDGPGAVPVRVHTVLPHLLGLGGPARAPTLCPVPGQVLGRRWPCLCPWEGLGLHGELAHSQGQCRVIKSQQQLWAADVCPKHRVGACLAHLEFSMVPGLEAALRKHVWTESENVAAVRVMIWGQSLGTLLSREGH